MREKPQGHRRQHCLLTVQLTSIDRGFVYTECAILSRTTYIIYLHCPDEAFVDEFSNARLDCETAVGAGVALGVPLYQAQPHKAGNGSQ